MLMAESGFKGKIGVIIITLALVISVFTGYAINVTTSTTTETQYDYVTDVSGLFNYDQTPTYVDYDVSKNYNGYTEYASNEQITKTDTYTNTAVNENWLTSTTFTGTIPYSAEYELYFTGGYMTIDDQNVTYKTSSMSAETTIFNLDHIAVVSNGLSIVLRDATTTLVQCDISSIIYRNISGYDSLGDGTKTLYQLAEGTPFYFKSTNTVYQIVNNVATQITSSTSGITAYLDGYTGTVSGVVLIDTLSVSLSTTTITTDTYNNTSASTYYMGLTYGVSKKSLSTSTITYPVNIYGDSGRITISEIEDNALFYEFHDTNNQITQSKKITRTTKITISIDSSTNKVGIKLISTSNTVLVTSPKISDANTLIMDGTNASNFGTWSSTINALTGTYYYTDSSNIYSFDTHVHTGVTGATALGNGYTGNVGSSLIWTNVMSVQITSGTTTSETKTNTQNTAHTEYEYGLTQGKNVNTSTEYRLYIGDKYIFWHGKDVYVYGSSTDHITLTTPMTIANNVLSITGIDSDSVSHSYSITLSSPYAYYSPLGDTLLTGSTLYRLSGTAYYKSSTTIFMYSGGQITTTIGGTSISHGVSSKTVGNTLVWSPSLSITSDSYYEYNMESLIPTGNGSGISYATTTQPNAYIVGNVENSGTGSKSLKDNSYTQLTVPEKTYAYINKIIHTDGTIEYRFIYLKNAVTITNYVASLGLPASTTEITISYVSNPNIYSVAPNFIYFGSKTVTNTAPYLPTSNFEHLITGYTQPIGYNNSPYTITYDVVNSCITNLSWYGDVNLRGSDYALYYNSEPYNSTVTPVDYLFYSEYHDSNDNYLRGGTSVEHSQASSINYAYSYTTPTYMDVDRGIYVNVANDHTVSRWNNGYHNGEVEIILHADINGTEYENTMTLSTGDVINVNRGTNLHTTITINNGDPYDVGVWASYVLSINAQSGAITVTPIDVFYNYTKIALYGYTYDVGNITGGREILYIDWNYTTSSLGFSVYKTQVFLDTYGAVMNNPSLPINNYFSNIENLRLNFRSFALYGDTMTINGQTYYGDNTTGRIIDTGKIFVQGRSYALQDIYVSYSTDGHTYLTFIDDKMTVDLGTTTTRTVSFAGYWYFTTELYEGKEVEVHTYDWHPDKFAINMQGLAILCLALTLLGTVIARRFLKEEMTAIDYILIIGAIAVFGALLGGIML